MHFIPPSLFVSHNTEKKEKWFKLDDPKSGRAYYVEKYSKRKTWTKPVGKKITAVVKSPPNETNSDLKHTWVRLRDKVCTFILLAAKHSVVIADDTGNEPPLLRQRGNEKNNMDQASFGR